MKILSRVLVAVALVCLGLGIILMGVSMITGGGYESVATHQTAMPYIEKAWDGAMVLLRGVMVLLFPAGT